MTDYPKVHDYTVQDENLGARIDHSFTQALSLYWDKDSGKVRFAASGRVSENSTFEGLERPMSGILNFPLESVREFLTKALENLPEREPVEVRVLTDLADEEWVQTKADPDLYVKLWHYDSKRGAHEGGVYGLPVLEIAGAHGIKTVAREKI